MPCFNFTASIKQKGVAMLDGSNLNQTEPALPEQPRYSLKAALGSPTKFEICTKMPTEEEIHKLWLLGKLGDEMTACLRNIHSYVTDRGTPRENTQSFNLHVAGTALFENHHQKKIKEKDHGIKSGTILNQVKGILRKISAQLRQPTLTQEEKALSEQEQQALILQKQDILTRFHALFTGHQAVLQIPVAKLPDEAQDHLKEHHGIDATTMAKVELSSPQKATVRAMLPQTPSPHKVPFEQKATPKKLNSSARKSIAALLAIEPPVPLPLPVEALPAAPNPLAPKLPVTSSGQLIPRALRKKHPAPQPVIFSEVHPKPPKQEKEPTPTPPQGAITRKNRK